MQKMAGAGLLMLLDDIAALMDDVALMTKVAARKSTVMADDVAVMSKVAMQKTAGVLGDDLALNAEQVAGVKSNRELPVVWAVAKGSLLNKLVLVPAFLLISAFVPWLITPLLMVGGAFLCFEGVEKILHSLHKRKHPEHLLENAQQATEQGVSPSSVMGAKAQGMDPVAYEKQKVSGAIRTDFILSAEILAIALSTIADQPLSEQVAVLVVVALAITVFVYGIVACIVRMDDVGMWLMRQSSAAMQSMGRGLIAFTPWLMKGLSIVGTAAMFLVGGSLLVHGIGPLQAWLDQSIVPQGGWMAAVLPVVVHVLVGAAIGGAIVALVNLWKRMRGHSSAH
jgi:predicted DNA repair protein MutK